MAYLLDIENIALRFPGYALSYVELIATLSGLVSVYLASRANILTWPAGIVNELFLFALFFQVQLYAEMFLQVFFFLITLYGWNAWNAKTGENAISHIGPRGRRVLAAIVASGTLASGFLFSRIHLYLPEYFPIRAAYPYADSFVMVSSVAACILLAMKKTESWHLWIAVDLVCVVLFLKKGVYFLFFEYLIFLALASYGLFSWRRLSSL